MKRLKNLKRFKLLVVSGICTFILAGCNNSSDSANNSVDDARITQVIDREGNTITKPDITEKIVSLAPSITETLVNLGLEDNIIAVDPYSLDIAGLNKDLPTFDIMTPNIESIAELEPDIVFATGMSNASGTSPFDDLIDLGTFVTVIPTPTSIAGIKEDILFIGEILEKSEDANKIVKDYSDKIEDIKSDVHEYLESQGNPDELTVYFETSPAPYMYSFGSNVFLNEYLELLQVQNIFGDLDNWLSISEEQVIDKNPDVIFTNATYEETPDQNIKNRVGWENISAVENNRVYVIDANESARPNENSINALVSMFEYLYD